MALSKEEVSKMVERNTTQLNVVVDRNLKFRIEDIILKKKRTGTKITQNELLTEYIIEGLEKDEQEFK